MKAPKVRDKYKPVTGCKRQLECEQIFWVFGFVTLLALYSIFVAPPIFMWDSIALQVFAGVAFVLVVPIAYDHCRLTCTDPVDPNIKVDMSYPQQMAKKRCSLCQLQVKKQTQHCLNCQRCTDNMDHHSQLVNNCISLNDITNYIRLNICFSVLMAIMFS